MFGLLFMMNIVCNDDVTPGENAWNVQTVTREETKEETSTEDSYLERENHDPRTGR